MLVRLAKSGRPAIAARTWRNASDTERSSKIFFRSADQSFWQASRIARWSFRNHSRDCSTFRSPAAFGMPVAQLSHQDREYATCEQNPAKNGEGV
jgi:hypothetical protein